MPQEIQNNRSPVPETVEGVLEAVLPKTSEKGKPLTDYCVRRDDGNRFWVNAAGNGNITEDEIPLGTRIRVQVFKNISTHPEYGTKEFSNAYQKPIIVTANGTPIPNVPDAALAPQTPAGQLLALGVEALRDVRDALAKIAASIQTPPPADRFDGEVAR